MAMIAASETSEVTMMTKHMTKRGTEEEDRARCPEVAAIVTSPH